jgi:hypothetical protein
MNSWRMSDSPSGGAGVLRQKPGEIVREYLAIAIGQADEPCAEPHG